MARINVVFFVLSTSLFCIDAEMNLATQVYNMTRLEKHSLRKAKRPNSKAICSTASYRTVTLDDFINKHDCFPDGWGDFLKLAEVQNEIKEISTFLSELVKDKSGSTRKGNKAQKVSIRSDYVIEPPMQDMFRAFTVPLKDVKVVIMGQDPVPQPLQATGLAFSLKPDKDPRSKGNVPSIFSLLVELKLEEVNNHLTNGDLTPWLKEGVLLLNAALTVKQGTSTAGAASHQSQWKTFTQLLIKYISDHNLPTAFILWGNEAKALAEKIDTTKHFIKAGGHPSPQGSDAGVRFFGRNYFKCANEFLDTYPIGAPRGRVDWSLPLRKVSGKQPEDCDENGLDS